MSGHMGFWQFSFRQMLLLVGLAALIVRLGRVMYHPFLAVTNSECVPARYSSGILEPAISGIQARNGCEAHIRPKTMTARKGWVMYLSDDLPFFSRYG